MRKGCAADFNWAKHLCWASLGFVGSDLSTQLLSSPGEINDIHLPFSKQHQGSDLLSAASLKNDDVHTKYR